MVRVMPHSSQDSYIQCPTASLDTHIKVCLSLLWALELLQQCENFFGIIVLQFVGCLLGGSMLGLIHYLPGLLQPEPLSPWQVAVELCLRRRHSNTQSQVSLNLLLDLWVLVHTRFCLSLPSRHLWWVWGLQ